jgi:hypothetical protein
LQIASSVDSTPVVEFAGRSVELRLLVLVHGANSNTNGVDQLRLTLDVIGINFDVIDVAGGDFDESMLRDGGRGFYNGIIISDSELRDDGGAAGLDRRQWEAIDRYARDFDVRIAVLTGFPGAEEGQYDYGMDGAEVRSGVVGEWTAAGAEVFGSVATDRPLELSGPAFAAVVRTDDTGPDVEPLLVDQADGRPLISLLTHADGREILLSTISMGEVHGHSYALVYDFIVFATSGLHMGAPRTHLATHVDDLFLGYMRWDGDANAADGSVVPTTPADIEGIVAAQERLTANHDTLDSFAVDFPFNGVGADLPDTDGSVDDELTRSVLEHSDALRFLNHTYEHRDLDVSAGAGFEDARRDLLRNRVMWELLDLPGANTNASVVVTGEHSGVWDDPLDGDESVQVPFPEGLNTEMARAFEEAGIRYLAGDASESSQARDQPVPGFDIVLLPRFPTGLLLNASTPDEQVDQYNWFFHERYVAAGEDPCTIPAANCSLFDYQDVLDDEAIAATRHMLSFRRWPHYFHMANVVDYDGQGSSLLGDWLDAVMTEYETRSKLPVENLTFAEIGARTEAELEARAANPVAVLDLEAGEVLLAAGRDVELTVTGLAGGEPYGPVVQSTVSVGPEPVRFAIEG